MSFDCPKCQKTYPRNACPVHGAVRGGVTPQAVARAVTASVPGPPGPQGLQGLQGEQGEPGFGTPGPPGYTPVKGVDYFDGEPGSPGAPGIGTQGPAGNDGAQGPKGDPGTPGGQGLPGNDGQQGIPGNVGPPGPAPAGTGYVHVTGGALDTPADITPAGIGAATAGHTHAGGGGDVPEPWEGKLIVARGDGNPSLDDVLFGFQNTVATVAAPTPTGIGASVGRLVAFRLKSAITVSHLYYFGIATVASLYTMALYRDDTGARLWFQDPVDTTAGWKTLTPGAPFVLPANVLLWFGLGAKNVGTTAGIRSAAACIANSLGVTALPGSLPQYGVRYAQVALTAGAWPTTLPARSNAAFASAAATGTLPILFCDYA